MAERIEKRDLNSYKKIAQKLENSLRNIERSGGDDNDIAYHGMSSVKEALGSIDPRIVFAPWTVDGERTNAILLDFDPQGKWTRLITQDWKYIEVSFGKKVKEFEGAAVVELNKKIPERLWTEIWLSEAQDGRARELVGEKVPV